MGELSDRQAVLKDVFNQFDRNGKGELSALEVQMLHGDLRIGGISYPQVTCCISHKRHNVCRNLHYTIH